jgi:hypothetical protein
MRDDALCTGLVTHVVKAAVGDSDAQRPDTVLPTALAISVICGMVCATWCISNDPEKRRSNRYVKIKYY